jgi:hypothetical protein
MAQGSTSVPIPGRARGAGTELWLLRAVAQSHAPAERQIELPAELAERLRAFASTRFGCVLSGPGPDERAWAAAFARAQGGTSSSLPELGARAAGESTAALAARAWSALEASLGAGPSPIPGPILAVLEPEVLGLAVARALGFPLERARALRVDPGRGVLLRDDPIGIVLRRSNARAPERASGTPLPSGRPEAAR